MGSAVSEHVSSVSLANSKVTAQCCNMHFMICFKSADCANGNGCKQEFVPVSKSLESSTLSEFT